ncbi:MAG: YbaK/EbsC family protein [Deltaproteobacteria bacterium]|nr:YbaK/EbsC family protein [Deltaproteobacteria bacterium]
MAIVRKLRTYLDRYGIHYIILSHHERFTAPEIAQALHVPGHMMMKVVLVKADDRDILVALDANNHIDLSALREAVGAKMVSLATEEEICERFPDCEVGAMPPFGNLYGMPVVVDEKLTHDEEIVFEAGNHHEAILLAYADFDRLVHPQVASFGVR